MEEPQQYFKQPVAMLFGYNGIGYSGLQVQNKQNVQTIQKTLFEALKESDLVNLKSEKDLKQINWMRGSRTDKGVHATTNCINFTMNIPTQFIQKNQRLYQKQREKENKEIEGNNETEIQQQLEENIQKQEQNLVENLVQKQKNDKDKKQIESQISNQQTKQSEKSEVDPNVQFFSNKQDRIDFSSIVNLINSNLPSEIQILGIKRVNSFFNAKQSCRDRLYQYILPLFLLQNYDDYQSGNLPSEEEEQQILDRVRIIIEKFKGTHNFHNYTLNMSPKDPKGNRYIMDMRANIVRKDEVPLQFIKITLNGQSFIYHQIRKMVGTVIQIFQNGYSDSYVDNTFFQNHINLWLAPAEGLYLNKMDFPSYNSRQDIAMPVTLTQSELQVMEQFEQYIVNTIFDAEIKDKIFSQWLDLVQDPKYDVLAMETDGLNDWEKEDEG